MIATISKIKGRNTILHGLVSKILRRVVGRNQLFCPSNDVFLVPLPSLTRAQLFSSANEFRAAKSQPLSESVNTKPVYFFDYDLGKGANGLDLLAEIKEDAEKYLVRGHFDDPEIRLRCEKDGVFLPPKSLLPEIPFVVV